MAGNGERAGNQPGRQDAHGDETGGEALAEPREQSRAGDQRESDRGKSGEECRCGRLLQALSRSVAIGIRERHAQGPAADEYDGILREMCHRQDAARREIDCRIVGTEKSADQHHVECRQHVLECRDEQHGEGRHQPQLGKACRYSMLAACDRELSHDLRDRQRETSRRRKES